MKIHYYGHSCFGIEIGDTHLLIDPFISGNDLAKSIDVETVSADFILITHAHQDHILDVESIGKRKESILISNYEITNYFIEKGLHGKHLNHGGSYVNDLFTVKYVNAVHTSSFPDGSYGGQPGGFVISSQNKNIYIAGDTAVHMDMKLLPLMYKKIDRAILPIGGTFTMGVEDAILACELLQIDTVIGCHYNTFPPIQIDKKYAVECFKNKNKNLILMDIGSSMPL